jgi:DNA-binding IclR family transcriptional regulator
LKALEILETLAQAESGLPLSELAEDTGYPISTAHRLLNTLAERGYVEQEPQTRRYYLGSKILTLQAQVVRHRQLVQRAFPHLNELKRKANGTVNLGVLSGKDAVYLESFVPDSALGFYSPPGTRMPPCCTAMGKLLLAHLDPAAMGQILSSTKLEPHTPHTITSLSELRAELSRIASRGYAVDDQEYAVGVRCVAAPVRDYSGAVIAGVSVTLPAEQLPLDRIEDTAALIVATCRDISRSMGHREAP